MIELTSFFNASKSALNLLNSIAMSSACVALVNPYGTTLVDAVVIKSLAVSLSTSREVLELNGCTIEAYPSNHIDAYRALDNPKFILIDEGDFFRKGEQEDVRHVSERYIAKSDPYIVMVSTPNTPDGLFERIEKESEETCIYKRIFLDYTYGTGKIYAAEEIKPSNH